MDRSEFLAKLCKMYQVHYTNDNAYEWSEAYNEVLPLTTDFEALLKRVYREYAGSTMPKPAWFTDKIEVKQGAEKERFYREQANRITTRSIYAQIGGRVYEFGYNPETETEEQIKTALSHRFRTKNIIIKEKSAVYGGGISEQPQRPSLDSFTQNSFNPI